MSIAKNILKKISLRKEPVKFSKDLIKLYPELKPLKVFARILRGDESDTYEDWLRKHTAFKGEVKAGVEPTVDLQKTDMKGLKAILVYMSIVDEDGANVHDSQEEANELPNDVLAELHDAANEMNGYGEDAEEVAEKN